MTGEKTSSGQDLVAEIPGLSNPAKRALEHAGIVTIDDLIPYTAKEVLALHGMGPKGIRLIREELERRGVAFAGEEPDR